MTRKRRVLPLAGYIVLAIATGYSIQHEHADAVGSRNDIVASTQEALYAACAHDNDTRAILRGLVASGIPQTRRYVREHTLTDGQGRRAIAESYAAIRKLADSNCYSLALQVK